MARNRKQDSPPATSDGGNLHLYWPERDQPDAGLVALHNDQWRDGIIMWHLRRGRVHLHHLVSGSAINTALTFEFDHPDDASFVFHALGSTQP